MKHLKITVLLFSILFISIYAQEKDAFEEKQDTYFSDVKKSFSNLKNHKTEHFYIIYTSPTPANYPKTLEGLFALFKRVMSIKPGEKVFNGRLEIYLWEKRAEFLKFAAEFEGFNASSAGGYFTITQMGWPRVNLPLETGAGGKEANYARNLIVLFHEGTHAMFSQYITDTPLPTWINEGLADYFAFSILEEKSFFGNLSDSDESKRRHVQFLKKQIQSNNLRPFRQLFHQQGTSGGADYEAYALGWCLTSLLLKSYKVQTLNFIKKVKNSAEYKGPEFPKGPMTAKEADEFNKKMNNMQKDKQKLLEDFFLESFKIDIDKFGETIYAQLKKNPGIIDGL